MTEDRMWDAMYRGAQALRARGVEIQLERHEEKPGRLDVEGCCRGQFWAELKNPRIPKTDRGKVRFKFRPKQPGWIRKRVRAGGQVYIVFVAWDKWWAIDGRFIDLLIGGVTRKDLEDLTWPRTLVTSTAEILLEQMGRHAC